MRTHLRLPYTLFHLIIEEGLRAESPHYRNLGPSSRAPIIWHARLRDEELLIDAPKPPSPCPPGKEQRTTALISQLRHFKPMFG
jgi:hypothetical protein